MTKHNISLKEGAELFKSLIDINEKEQAIFKVTLQIDEIAEVEPKEVKGGFTIDFNEQGTVYKIEITQDDTKDPDFRFFDNEAT